MLRVLDQRLTSDEVTAKASVLRQSANALTCCVGCTFGTLFSCQVMYRITDFRRLQDVSAIKGRLCNVLRRIYIELSTKEIPISSLRYAIINGRVSQHFTCTAVTKTGNVLRNYHTPDYIIYVQEQLTL
jgi:hypothetical protein